ncbi:MAG: bifunctional riboflavin kinase/FMN adenylyltransferase [Pseudomonadota bacterium]
MQRFDGYDGALVRALGARALAGCTVAVGNFDGVHRGHQALVEAARAALPEAPLAVVTFEPHPRQVFQPDAPPFRLTTDAERARRIAALGVERLVVLPFDDRLRHMAPATFARDVLASGQRAGSGTGDQTAATGLGVAHVTVGADFRFGRGRQGDAEMLRRLGEALGFGVTVLPMVGDETVAQPPAKTASPHAPPHAPPHTPPPAVQPATHPATQTATAPANARPSPWRVGRPRPARPAEPVEQAPPVYSSTAARAAVRAGRMAEAAAILGRPHAVTGPVVKGDQRGRLLGYPTANLAFGDQLIPAFGVYAARVQVLDGPHAGWHAGVASIGERPTFGVNAPNFEVHLFDFEGDLYGTQIVCALVAYLRGEIAYTAADALVAQMDRDSAEARAVLAGATDPPDAATARG